MLNLSEIYPLTGFLRDHKSHLQRLRNSGQPEVLTVNGRASVVVQDAAAYQKLMEAFERLATEEVLRNRLESIRNGEPGIPADQVLQDIRGVLSIKEP
ncbi:MAG: hypothetical protein HYV27_18070 [Candidatus Hydrogenedentes bacterium]|nr:hypothetical protein [Candidatus Hydrogenedentota bacterium]